MSSSERVENESLFAEWMVRATGQMARQGRRRDREMSTMRQVLVMDVGDNVRPMSCVPSY